MLTEGNTYLVGGQKKKERKKESKEKATNFRLGTRVERPNAAHLGRATHRRKIKKQQKEGEKEERKKERKKERKSAAGGNGGGTDESVGKMMLQIGLLPPEDGRKRRR